MRKYIDISHKLFEAGELIDFNQYKKDKEAAKRKPIDDYLDSVQGIYQGEKSFFANGKFSPFAQSFIKSGFDSKYQPNIELEVRFRDPRPKPEARELIKQLSARHFKYLPATEWAKGTRPRVNTQQEAWGPWLETVIDLNTAKDLFANRENSPYGVYQPSEAGFRTAHQRVWDARGVGFNIIVSGYDNRRGDKYGNDARQEAHVIDNDQDMAEVVNLFAAIRRAQIKGVS